MVDLACNLAAFCYAVNGTFINPVPCRHLLVPSFEFIFALLLFIICIVNFTPTLVGTIFYSVWWKEDNEKTTGMLTVAHIVAIIFYFWVAIGFFFMGAFLIYSQDYPVGGIYLFLGVLHLVISGLNFKMLSVIKKYKALSASSSGYTGIQGVWYRI